MFLTKSRCTTSPHNNNNNTQEERCPSAAELGEGGGVRGDPRRKPPSPVPVLYSIVPDDQIFDSNNIGDSPCLSYSAIYEVPTPGDETPNILTPNGGTPSFMTPHTNTPVAETPNATTPISVSPNTINRHDNLPTSYSNEMSYAITNSTADAINIATNNAFNKYISTTQF
ncbi:hypothetical protein SK128_004214 [Halocaridina rubra]|uniref:Uncharacterized protein n=1 Tax=Halocaridina rubra TaxID=373956 RepID=A0AAN9AC37_HALRR